MKRDVPESFHERTDFFRFGYNCGERLRAAVVYGAGKVARFGYNTLGGGVDFVSGAGVDRICH